MVDLAPKRQRFEAKGAPLAYYHGPTGALSPLAGAYGAGLFISPFWGGFSPIWWAWFQSGKGSKQGGPRLLTTTAL
jgi:hypothetical protein